MSIKIFKDNRVSFDDVIDYLRTPSHEKPQICFPFDGCLHGNPYDTVTKILYVNFRESTQIKNRDITKLSEHIAHVLNDDDYEVLVQGLLDERYFEVVDKIAFGHGITGKSSTEFNLTSFASKYCGSHNQKAPFWDNLVSDFLKYLKFHHETRNYRAYVTAFKELQKKKGLENYTLREIEEAMWKIASNLV